MKRGNSFLLAVVLLAFIATTMAWGADENKSPKIRLVIHGGAGVITPASMTPEKEKAIREQLDQALDAGYSVLKGGGTALDAVTACIRFMEDSPYFNAGKGAVFTSEGKNEMDASIMDGKTHMAGAVASVSTIRNPILAARAVMEKSPHVLLVGRGAEEFAKSVGLQIVDPQYFWTAERYKQWQEAVEKEKQKKKEQQQQQQEQKKEAPGKDHGTVGAVALDSHGNLAAATSTGGTTNKHPGRVGDTPIIGAGTYADNDTCAVSGTGIGELFIRGVAAYDIAALMKYKGLTVKEAAEEVILRKLGPQGADGGAIALDRNGNFVMTFSTVGMYRGFVDDNGGKHVFLYKEEK